MEITIPLMPLMASRDWADSRSYSHEWENGYTYRRKKAS